MSKSALRAIVAALTLATGGSAAAQLPGGALGLPGAGLPGVGLPVGGLPPIGRGATDLPAASDLRSTVRGELDPAEGALAAIRDAGAGALQTLRARVVARLLRDHRDLVEADDLGQPVVRGEVLALAPSPTALAAAQQAGFRMARTSDLAGLGLEAVVLRPPRGVSARDAVRRLRELDPQGAYDFNHLFQASSAGALLMSAGGPVGASESTTAKIGLVDGSVAARHPALRGAKIDQKAFAPGGVRVTDHATAVASLMVGEDGRFRGAAPGAALLVADVYGPTAAGGSAEAIARGLSWLVQNDVAVIDISLVGPSNRLLQLAVAATLAKGRIVVAAVGNDGPAAPPLYPAAYPGVVSVTAVDANRRVLPEAGRGGHVDFAAPGADMAAAGARGGYLVLRGTSFAAPLVAGAIARRMTAAGPQAALAALDREATDLGAPGPDPIYGRGLVGFDLRTDPRQVHARP